jgi:haloalkane dehalogenase
VLLKPKLFIEDVLSAWMLRTLDDDELGEYRRPFATPGEDRLPVLTMLRQVPICGEPAEVVEVVAAYAA